MVKNKIKLPNIKKIHIDLFKLELIQMKEFFKHCWPDQVEIFILNWYHRDYYHMPLEYYFDGMKKVIPTVTRQLFFYTQNIQKHEFEFIMSNARAERLVFRWVGLDYSEQFNFNCINSDVKSLALDYTGRNDRDNWAKYPDRFENILQGILNSSLKNSLTTMNLHNCGFNATQLEDIQRRLTEAGSSITSITSTSSEAPLDD